MTFRQATTALVVLVALFQPGTVAWAQAPTDAELRRLTEAYTQAWNKGDAKAVAALHTTEGLRVGVDGRVAVGRKAIEQAMLETLTGPYRGTRLGLVEGQATRAGQDVYVAEGTFTITGGMPPADHPTRGRYVHTIVRLNGRWLIAGQAIIGQQRPPRQ
jgi:uncharacterized protein (TIGR02246 family)